MADARRWGTGVKQRIGNELKLSPTGVPDSTNLSFHMSRMIADYRRNLGCVMKIETLPIFLRPSRAIGDVYDVQFSLVGKVWDGWVTVKSSIAWDFPDI